MHGSDIKEIKEDPYGIIPILNQNDGFRENCGDLGTYNNTQYGE